MLDIFLVVVGIGLIILSYVISDKMDAKNGNKASESSRMDIWTEKEEEIIRKRIEEMVLETTEEAMIKTDDQLSQISNEKIMAVSEFSDQVLEKINQNHTEVVFLYDMLNEKDEKLRELLRDINSVKAKTEAVMNLTTTGSSSEKSGAKKVEAISQLKTMTKAVKNEKVQTVPKTAMDLLEESKKIKKVPMDDSQPDNRNAEILELFKQGNSVMEIAKILEMGQGEVKLVIDLYQRTRG